MNEIKKAYEVLKLQKDASLAEINSKYRILLDEYDPEKQTDDLKDFFRKERESVINSYMKIVEHLSKIKVDNTKRDTLESSRMERILDENKDDNSKKTEDKMLNEDFKSEDSFEEKIENKSNNLKTFISNRDILSDAWDSLSGYWGLAIGFSFLFGIITSFASNLFLIPLLLISGPLSIGYSIFTLNLVRKKNPEIGNMFEGFNFFGKALGLYFLYTLIILGGFVLLIIPGIYFSLMFSQSYFILADNPNIKVTGALRKSREIMDGSMLKLFFLQLMYLVLIILSIFTLFIGLIVIIPWIRVTNAKFYEYLKNNSKD
tara:strand:- start:220 stop:1170 length:951 start_codon:yes stop_codon:yes gene_type:complete